jgi:hypothetical protein
MKVILNKTKNSSGRYTLVSGSMGRYGEPKESPNHKFEVCNGIDKGKGYQGYMAVTYALSEDSCLPKEAKEKLKATLKALGYNI